MSIALPQPLSCPFCGARCSKPVDLNLDSYESSEGNECICGAFYALDATSHNLGKAMLDAYCYAAGGTDEALDLDPEKDIDEAIVSDYDEKTNTVRPKKSPGYSGSSLYFVRLRPEAAERLTEKNKK